MSVYIIAEAGCNHGGNLEAALSMICSAAELGYNAIKFQAYVTEKINDPSLHEDLSKWGLSEEDFACLKRYCQSREIDFLCSSFDIESAEMLERLDIIAHKVPAGQVHNIEYLKYIASTHKPAYLSTGMCSLEEVMRAVKILQKNKLVVMHCTTGYPVPLEEVNLSCIREYQRMGYLTGLSDHTMSWHSAVAAVAMGVKTIEHHFTRGFAETPDTPASWKPEESRYYIHHIRATESILGDGIKKIEECEKKHLHRRDYTM